MAIPSCSIVNAMPPDVIKRVTAYMVQVVVCIAAGSWMQAEFCGDCCMRKGCSASHLVPGRDQDRNVDVYRAGHEAMRFVRVAGTSLLLWHCLGPKQSLNVSC